MKKIRRDTRPLSGSSYEQVKMLLERGDGPGDEISLDTKFKFKGVEITIGNLYSGRSQVTNISERS